MHRYTIKVFGPQCGDPPSVIRYLHQRFAVSYARTAINPPDEVLHITFLLDAQTEVVVSAVIPAVLHKSQTYRLHLDGADGILYVLNASRGLAFHNRDDFAIFAPLYRTHTPAIPVVTLLNDFWAGGCTPGLWTPPEVQAYVLDQSPLFETVLADSTQTVGMDAVAQLIARMRASREAHNPC
jgi:hypothetical protein